MFIAAAESYRDATAIGAVAPALTIVVPTYNERANIGPLAAAVAAAMGETAWEMIVVDDDSDDGTHAEARSLAMIDPRVRCIRRVGRRGLASAVVEGALAASAPVIAVIDADFQHDERLLPRMLATIEERGADLVVGTRYADGGDTDGWNAGRRRLSDVATRASRLILGDATSDPMSGFFAMRREVLDGCVHRLSQTGYKILLDIITASPKSLVIEELPYRFRGRREGASKLSAVVLADYAGLIVEKATRGLVPARFVLFGAVGGAGLVVHLAVLAACKAAGTTFLPAQATAIAVAMLFNYALNNAVTYRDRRLTGLAWGGGLILFCVVCSIGAAANVGVADLAIRSTHSWSIAGVAGAVMGALFNFGAAGSVVWGRRRK